jgi:hypothetical protein
MIYMLEAILFHQPTEMLFDVTCVNVAQKKEYVLFYGGCALGRCVNFVILLLPLPMFHSLQLLNGDVKVTSIFVTLLLFAKCFKAKT